MKLRLLSPLPSFLNWQLSTTTPCSQIVSSSHPFNNHLQQQIRSTSNRSSSSSQYLQRQAGDRFVKARLSPSTSSSASTNSIEADTTFVARSAFKLLHLQSKWNGRLIKRGMTIIDLGAAPGSWIQAARVEMDRSGAKVKGRNNGGGDNRAGEIIGVDLLPLTKSVASLENVHFVQGDFLDPLVQAKVVGILRRTKGSSGGGGGGGGKVDLVLSDMLANLSGNPFRDSQLSIDLCQAALQFALVHLSPPSSSFESTQSTHFNSQVIGGGVPKKLSVPPSLIMKCLQSSLSDSFQKELLIHFKTVRFEKPPSSRPESREGYWCCSSLKKSPSSSTTSSILTKNSKDSIEVLEEEDSIYF